MDEGMNKSKLVDSIADRVTGVSKTDISNILTCFIDVCSESLAEGKQVKLASFGTWSIKPRAARSGRNPKTGGTITIPAKNVIKFKAAQKLKTDVE